MSVISIKVKGDRRIGEDVSYRRGVERKKEGTKDRTLRNPGREWEGGRLMIEYRNELGAIRQVGGKKIKSRAREAKS